MIIDNLLIMLQGIMEKAPPFLVEILNIFVYHRVCFREVKMLGGLQGVRRDVQFEGDAHRAGDIDGARILAASANIGAAVLGSALFIIGCVAAAGYLSGVVAGGCAVGISVPLLLMYLAKGVRARTPAERSQAVTNAILMLAVVIIGALGLAGVLPATTVGWVTLAPAIIGLAISCCNCCCCGGGLAIAALLGASALSSNNV